MILVAFDTETTGLDRSKDEVIEAGVVLYTTGQTRTLESFGRLVKTNLPISQEVTEVTGITQSALGAFGFNSDEVIGDVIDLFNQADAIVAHNGLRFDGPVARNWAKRHGLILPEKLWIDTMFDLPGIESMKLKYLAAELGFLPLEEHSALADAQTVLKAVMHPRFNIEEIVARAESPIVVVQAHQARGENNKAKKLKFRWNPDAKMWWKALKEVDVEQFSKQCPFDISLADKSVDLDQLWD